AVLLEVASLQFRQQLPGWETSRFTQESPLSWKEGMLDPDIREHFAILLPYLRHPHPYLEEFRPLGIVSQYSLNDRLLHREKNRGRCPHASTRTNRAQDSLRQPPRAISCRKYIDPVRTLRAQTGC